jgi:hypothetical protein
MGTHNLKGAPWEISTRSVPRNASANKFVVITKLIILQCGARERGEAQK